MIILASSTIIMMYNLCVCRTQLREHCISMTTSPLSIHKRSTSTSSLPSKMAFFLAGMKLDVPQVLEFIKHIQFFS